MTRTTVLLSAVLGLAALSGCIGADDGSDPAATGHPDAQLAVDRTERWSGEAFTFDASSSYDPNGAIETMLIDFGDGETMEVDNVSEADEIVHRYERAGEYAVTVTVTDDGSEQEQALSDTESVKVYVHERHEIANQVLYAAPTPNSTAAKTEYAFDVDHAADVFEMDLDVDSAILVGDSEMRITVTGPADEVIVNETFIVGQGETVDVSLTGDLLDNGTYTTVFEVLSGGASFDGELRVYYDGDTHVGTDDEASDEA